MEKKKKSRFIYAPAYNKPKALLPNNTRKAPNTRVAISTPINGMKANKLMIKVAMNTIIINIIKNKIIFTIPTLLTSSMTAPMFNASPKSFVSANLAKAITSNIPNMMNNMNMIIEANPNEATT